MFDRENDNRVAEIVKTHAVIAGPKTKLRRIYVSQPLDVSFAVSEISGKDVEYVEGCSLIDGTKLRFG